MTCVELGNHSAKKSEQVHLFSTSLRRPRRNRKNPVIRDLAQETRLNVSDLIYPIFLTENAKEEIPSMPGIFRHGPNDVIDEIKECMDFNLNAFVLFPLIAEEKKDKTATLSYNKDNFYLKTIEKIKSKIPKALIITDVAMDPYSSDGHDGLLVGDKIDNDKTLDILSKMSLAQANAGADILGPSDMMDGRISHIRNSLDENGFTDVSIMSYTTKYASSFYSPFRDALDSQPKKYDKKTYQMNPANRKEAKIEALLDVQEGADILMCKPALCYLDIISDLKQNTNLPIAAYNVSGEYSMVMAASLNGWIERDKIMNEILISIKRAGADMILTYFAKLWASQQS